MRNFHLVKDFGGEVECGVTNPTYVTLDIAGVTCTDCLAAAAGIEKPEKLYICCISCGEVFDELIPAKAHEMQAGGSCEAGSYEILHESEAF